MKGVRMEKFIRVSDINKEKYNVLTAEEIADSVRGVMYWEWNGVNFICTKCGCASRENSRFCKFCGARRGDA